MIAAGIVAGLFAAAAMWTHDWMLFATASLLLAHSWAAAFYSLWTKR